MQPLLFKLLALVEHLLHVLIVRLNALVQLVQDLHILFFSLNCKIIFYNQLTVSSVTLACLMTHKHVQSWKVSSASCHVGQEIAFLPSHSPVCICLICRWVFSAGQPSQRLLPYCWLLWQMPPSHPCRPCGRTSWQPRAKERVPFSTTYLLCGTWPNYQYRA